MNTPKKHTSRIEFDCPPKLLILAKKKAKAQNKSLDEYFLGLIMKDSIAVSSNYVDQETFDKVIKQRLKDDDDLLRNLSQR